MFSKALETNTALTKLSLNRASARTRPRTARNPAPLSPADNQITDAGARALAAGIRANKKNGGKLTKCPVDYNYEMKEAGSTIMAEAMHAAALETAGWESAVVKGALAALRARDNDQTAALLEVLKEIKRELGKTEFKNSVTEFKMQM